MHCVLSTRTLVGCRKNWAWDCNNPKKEGKKEQAHLAQADNNEPTLLMAQVCSLSDADEEDGAAEHLPQ
jgi:hypothetical protein